MNPMTAQEILTAAWLIEARSREAKIRFLSDEQIVEGTLRRGDYNADGSYCSEQYPDFRNLYVRITTRTGLELFASTAELMDRHTAGELAAGWVS